MIFTVRSVAQTGKIHIRFYITGNVTTVNVSDTVSTLKKSPPFGDSVISASWLVGGASSNDIFIDTTVQNISNVMLLGKPWNIQMTIDTVASLITHLQISRPFNTISFNNGSKTVDGGETLTYDSLVLPAGASPRLSAQYDGRTQWNAFISKSFHSGPFLEYGTGSCTGAIRDSIMIWLNAPQAIVSNMKESYAPDQEFQVWNIQGVLLLRGNGREYRNRISALPPGCYFARLSGGSGASEVVKLVVP